MACGHRGSLTSTFRTSRWPSRCGRRCCSRWPPSSCSASPVPGGPRRASPLPSPLSSPRSRRAHSKCFDPGAVLRKQWRVLLTITTVATTRAPATDLGYLLHKHPDRLQSFDVTAGRAHVFYPEATADRCTAALLLEIDPITLVRGPQNAARNGGRNAAPGSKPGEAELAQYVNDRPYAASSMLAVALKDAFRTALSGRCDARPALAATPIPLEIGVPALRCRGGGEQGSAALAAAVFAPLGWSVDARPQP